MSLQDDYNTVLDYFFLGKKLQTPNRTFFNLVENANGEKLFSQPWTVSWQITSKCNLRCAHCFFKGDEANYTSADDLKEEDLLRLADELIALNVVGISISGGEAITSPCLLKLIKKLKDNHVAVSVQTNATLINDETASELSSLLSPHTDFVQVSLDGSNEEIYEKIRGKNTFKRAINGLKSLQNKGISININTTALSYNKNDLADIYTLTDSLAAKKMSISRFVPCVEEHSHLDTDFASLVPALAEAIKISEKSETLLELNFRFYDYVESQQLRNFADEYFAENKLQKTVGHNISCHKHNTLYINAKGKVYLCFACELKDGLLGSYPEEALSQIWENRKQNLFFEPKFSDKSYCKKCKYFKYCLGGCMGSAYKTYNSIYAPDGLCKYYKSQ